MSTRDFKPRHEGLCDGLYAAMPPPVEAKQALFAFVVDPRRYRRRGEDEVKLMFVDLEKGALQRPMC